MATATDGTHTLSFAYNADGLRMQKTVNGVVHNYFYDGGKLIRESYGDTVLDFFYDANGYPFMMKMGDAVYYYITSAQGDVTRLVDENGVNLASYRYDPYGKATQATGSLAAVNPLRYRGYIFDSETGLYYLQSRYYDPETGRFLNADAFASTGQGLTGNNMFAYCNNTPVMHSDSTGYFMAFMDFLNRAGGPSGMTSVDSGGGGYSTSYDVARGDFSVTNKGPSFSPGKRDPQELWNEITDDIMSIVTAKDNLPEQYPGIKLYQGGKDVHAGVGHIKAGVELLMLPVPTPLDDILGVGHCIHGILQAAGGLVKSIIAVDRLG